MICPYLLYPQIQYMHFMNRILTCCFIVADFFLLLIGCKPTAQQKSSSINNTVTFASAEDEKIFTEVERATFQYFWDGAEPTSGLARERFHNDNMYPQNDKNIVTSGGGGFGVMAILVGIERNFISRGEGYQRLQKIVSFLELADRFHGAWPHWWNGETGKVKPFSRYDDGGDLVESSFMIQGLLCVRQYFKDGNQEEKALAERIDKLWKEVEFDWYRNGKNVLYWHWSPNHAWRMNFRFTGTMNVRLCIYSLHHHLHMVYLPKYTMKDGRRMVLLTTTLQVIKTFNYKCITREMLMNQVPYSGHIILI